MVWKEFVRSVVFVRAHLKQALDVLYLAFAGGLAADVEGA